MESFNKYNYTNNDKDRFLEYLWEIERNKIWPITGAITYKTQEVNSLENYITKEFFNENNKIINIQDIDTCIGFISRGYNNLKTILKDIQQDQVLSEEQKTYIINSIKDIQTRQLMIMNWVYIEAEKGGYKLDPKKRDVLKQRIKLLSEKIRGPNVSEVKEEKQSVLKEIDEKMESNKKRITNQEYKTIINFLNEQKFDFTNKNSKENLNWNNKLSEKKISLDKYTMIIKMILEEIYGIKPTLLISHNINFLSWEKNTDNSFNQDKNIVYFKEWLNEKEKENFLKENNINEHFKINIDSDKKNMSAWANNINIPYIDNYLELNIETILKKIEHELKHVFRARKSINTLPITTTKGINNMDIVEQERWFKNTNSTDIEEGIAKFSEEAIDCNIEDMNANIWYGHIATFIAEKYNFDDAKKLMTIYLKLDSFSDEAAEKEAETRIKRVKRFFPLDEPWAYGKETVYYRNKKNIIDLVKDLQIKWKREKLEELTKSAYIAKIDEANIDGFWDVVKDWINEKDYNKIPYEIGKIIYNKLLDKNINEVKKWDIRFSFNEMNYKTKKALCEIISFTKDSIK